MRTEDNGRVSMDELRRIETRAIAEQRQRQQAERAREAAKGPPPVSILFDANGPMPTPAASSYPVESVCAGPAGGRRATQTQHTKASR